MWVASDPDSERGPVLEPASLFNVSRSKTWNAFLSQGFYNSQVLALAVPGSDLYVGGYCTVTGDGVLANLGNDVLQ